MVFVDYKFGLWKKEIKNLLRERLRVKAKVRYHKEKIELNKKRICNLQNQNLKRIEKDLNSYLKKAGNNI